MSRSGAAKQITSRRRLERHRSAVVARRHADRVRLRSHRQGVRREPQHATSGSIDADGGPPTKISDHERRQLAALVARRPDDRVHRRRCRGRAHREDLARAGRGGGRRALAAEGLDLIPDGAALGGERTRRSTSRPASRGRAHLFRVDLAARQRGASHDRASARVRAVDVNEQDSAPRLCRRTIRRIWTICTSPISTAATKALTHLNARAVEAAGARRRSSACPSRAPTAGTSTAS